MPRSTNNLVKASGVPTAHCCCFLVVHSPLNLVHRERERERERETYTHIHNKCTHPMYTTQHTHSPHTHTQTHTAQTQHTAYLPVGQVPSNSFGSRIYTTSPAGTVASRPAAPLYSTRPLYSTTRPGRGAVGPKIRFARPNRF